MAIVEVTIKDRIATAPADAELVCNNPTDTIRFSFDAEWASHSVKTARFSWEGKYIDVPFSGNEVQAPEIFRTNYVFVGVFADNIASTPAKLRCRYSIKCMGGNVVPPTNDVYEQIIELINSGAGAGGNPPLVGTTAEITPSQVLNAISTEHRDVIVRANFDFLGLDVTFTSFFLIGALGLFATTFTPEDDGTFSALSLIGTIETDEWTGSYDRVQGVNPNALTFTGAVSGTYDGSEQVYIDIPTIAGEKGADGISVTSVEQVVQSVNDGGSNMIRVTLSDGTHSDFIVRNGSKGDTGDAGVGVESASQVTTSTSDKGTNVFRFTLSDGTTRDFSVRNGSQGSQGIQGEQGPAGADGAKGDKGDAGADGYSPVRGVDYWTEADQTSIVQQVISELGGVPIIGTVNDDNSISLTGALADGTYTLKYVQSDGSSVTIGELVVGDVVEIVNWIPKSTDTDGTVYNGTGWKTGYRINSSGNVTALSGYELTGFIPFTKGDVLRGNEGIIGLAAAGGNVSNTNYNVISLFDSSQSFITNVGLGASSTADGLTINDDDSFVFDSSLNSDVTDSVGYIRVTTVNITASAILTVNQEIE